MLGVIVNVFALDDEIKSSVMPYIFIVLIPWGISSVMTNTGIRKRVNTDSIKKQVKDALYEHEHGSGSIIAFVLSTIFAPVYLILLFVGYYRSKATYKKEVESLAAYRELIGE